MVSENATEDPLQLFIRWFEQAKQEPSLSEPTAATLATVSRDGKPSARIVLLKEASEAGFKFFTNYSSRKSRELEATPYAALCCYWMPLNKQVRIEGRVERLSPEESEAYFASRPRESQLGAWASKQSQPGSSEELAERFLYFDKLYAGKPVPRPDFWGGFRLIAESIEFWQVGAYRLHHRLRYERSNGQWLVQQLFP